MIALDCNQPTFFDVDDTLIMWSPTQDQIDKYGIVTVNDYGEEEIFVPHIPHVEQLKKHAVRGHTIIVWSKGGSKWAEKAVKILNLQNYVAITMAKPEWFYDDKQPEEFMGKPQFLEMQK